MYAHSPIPFVWDLFEFDIPNIFSSSESINVIEKGAFYESDNGWGFLVYLIP